jgi:hypothetical protein
MSKETPSPQPMLRRLACLLLGMCVLASARWGADRPAHGAFAPYVARALPQRAAADFDADGRPDVARIQDGRDGSRVVLTLSGSRDAVALDMDAVSVATSDVDHDGDTDLVVATSSNHVVIWLNDGRGHFTEERPAPSRDLSSETTVANAPRDELAAVGLSAPQVAAPGRRLELPVVSTRSRHPSVFALVGPAFLALPAPRGPPLSATLT